MKVLIVDKEITARILKAELQKLGYSPLIETNAEKALRYVAEQEYKIIFIDPTPPMNGRWLCQEIRRLTLRHPVYIVLFSRVRYHDQLLESGADVFIRKPFNPIELRNHLDNAKRLVFKTQAQEEKPEEEDETGNEVILEKSAFKHFYEVAFARCHRYNEKGGLIFMRVENHKKVRDEQGDEAAATLIEYVSSCISKIARKSDPVGQTAEDEFCLLIQNAKDNEPIGAAKRFIDKLESSLKNYVDGVERPLVSIYAAEFPVGQLDSEAVFVRRRKLNL